jgi:hypothetical protein
MELSIKHFQCERLLSQPIVYRLADFWSLLPIILWGLHSCPDPAPHSNRYFPVSRSELLITILLPSIVCGR